MATNPVTLAALFMSPGSIGLPGDAGGVVAVPDNVKTAEQFVAWMIRNQPQIWFPSVAHVPTMPGYTIPDGLFTWIDVPNAELGTGSPHGTTKYHSIETDLAIAVQGLAGFSGTQNLTDLQVATQLKLVAQKAEAYLLGHDPALADVAALIQRYVSVYRTAVTPV